VIRAYRSTRGVNVNDVVNGSAGNGRSTVFSNAKSCPTVLVRLSMRRCSCFASAAAKRRFSSSIESTTGIGTQCQRRKPADLALDPALLVRALDTGQAVERVEPESWGVRDF
jgi:hypothetical protein